MNGTSADTIEEWDDVVVSARKQGITIHIGHLFGICVEKGSELADLRQEDGSFKKDPPSKI